METLQRILPRQRRKTVDTTLRKIGAEWKVDLDSLEKSSDSVWLFLGNLRGDRDAFDAVAIYIRNHSYKDYETASSAFPTLDLSFRSTETMRLQPQAPGYRRKP